MRSPATIASIDPLPARCREASWLGIVVEHQETLDRGLRVSFERATSNGRPAAQNVKVLDDAPVPLPARYGS